MFAERYHWPPQVVYRLDPDFVSEVLARWAAESDYADFLKRRAQFLAEYEAMNRGSHRAQ